jgi:MFS transporter, SHS family, sialic acid transporter
MTNPITPLSRNARITVLVVAFVGWFCAGMDMSMTQLAGRDAAIDLFSRNGKLDREQYDRLSSQSKLKEYPLAKEEKEQLRQWDEMVARWFAWFQCAFLFGAATGGLVFGWLGDRFGRARGMSVSIFTYSAFAGAAYFAQTPEQMLVLWYLACMGVGGMWPNGVALVSEAWSGMSRPMIAGVIGTSANIGIFMLATIAARVAITPDSWRWVMLVGASPMVLAIVSITCVSESPRWLAARRERLGEARLAVGKSGVFRPPLLWITALGIILATTPLIGGWGTANWMIPWADKAGKAAEPPNPFLKAEVQQARALTGIVGSLLGGWIASYVGRRRTYFLVSVASLLIAQYTFWFLYPTDRSFLIWVAMLGFFSGIYFGWLPLFLPELFPTRVRSTGSGVSFNFGRIVTAGTIFATGLMMAAFEGDFARIGRVTSLIFLVGMVAIWFAPDTSRNVLDEPVAKSTKATLIDD